MSVEVSIEARAVAAGHLNTEASRGDDLIRRCSVTLLAAWPLGLLVLTVATQHALPSAGWCNGWTATVTCCAVAAYLLHSVAGFDIARLQLPAVFAMSYPIFVTTGVPAMTDEFGGTVGAQRLVVATTVGFLFVIAGIMAVGSIGSGWMMPRGGATSWLQRIVAVGALCSGLMILLYYVRATGTPPIVDAARGQRGDALAQARQDAVVSLTNPIARYGFNFVRLYLLPVASAALVVTWLRRRTWGAAIGALTVTGVAFVTAALTLEKSPVVRLVLIIVLAAIVGADLRIRLRWMIVIAAASVTFPLLVLTVGNPESSILDVARLFGDRIFVDPARVLYHYFQWAPGDSNGFLRGRLLPYVGSGAGPEVKVTQIISNRIFPNATVQGNANAAFLGNLWVDFGWWGVTIGALFGGVVIGLLQRIVSTIRNQALGAAVTGLLCLQVVFLVQTSLFDAVVSIGLGVLDVVLFAFVWTRILAIDEVPRGTVAFRAPVR